MAAAGFEQGLAGRRLALARHQAVAEIDVLDQLAVDAGALDGGLDRDGAQVVRGLAEKSPWKAPIGVRAAPTMTIGSFIF
jgi:hypothetical protein